MSADLRLAIPAIVAWVAVGILIALPGLLVAASVASWGAAAGAVVAAVAMHVSRARAVMGSVALAGIVVALVLSSAAVASSGRRPQLLQDAAAARRSVTATVVTSEVRHPDEARGRLAVTIVSMTVGSRTQAVSIPALLFGASQNPAGCGRQDCGIGTVLGFSGRVVETAPEDGVAVLAFARSEVRLLKTPPWYLAWSNALRSRFLESAVGLPGDGGGLLPGLSIGDTSAVSATLDADMKSTSLSHLTAVSGANCAVVIALIMLAGAAMGLPRGLRIGASLVVLTGFVVLVTPSASVLRSAVMAALVLVAMARGRPVRGVPVLSLAVIILLTVDPWLARDYGFILSVLATAGLLVIAGPLSRVLRRWLPGVLAAVIAIPLSAQLVCQPVLILLNPSIPVYGVVANLLSAPAAPAATVLGLIACVMLPVFAPLGHAVTVLAWLPSAWIAAVARFFATLPGSQAPWLPGAIGVALAAIAVLGVLVVALAPRLGAGRVPRVVATVLVVSLVGYVGAVAGSRIRWALSMPVDWQIAACDVGQGDAVLVRDAGQIALVDTGPDPIPLAACLRRLGVGSIQLLVLTHYDLDHVGGTAAVLGMVERAIVGPVSDAHDGLLRKSLIASGARVEQVSQGVSGRLGSLAWRVLWPPARPGAVQPGNDASVTVAFEGAGACPASCLSSVFLGDLGERAQARVLAANRMAAVDVVKVAHHGSADQDPQLYERLRARVGIIGVGAGNDYGHPTDALLQILSSAGTAAERTDVRGMVLVSADAQGAVRVWSERSPK